MKSSNTARARPRAAVPSWAIVLALVVSTFAAFWPVGHNGFVGFDDPRYITANEQVRAGLTAAGTAWAFTTTHAFNWHPLTWISHMADVEMFGLDPGSHHLVSVAIHAANAVLLFALLRSLEGAVWPSALVAFLFALHPLRVESVAWASERKDVLGALLWLATMRLYVSYARRPSARRYALVAAAFAAGLMAKPMLVSLPLVLLLIDFWPLDRLRQVGLSRLLLEKTPLLVLAAAASVMTLRAQRGIVQTVESFPLSGRIANAALSCARYLGKMVWPVDLAVFYPYRERSLASPEVLGALAILAALTALALVLRRRGYPVVGWLWFLGTLVPVLGLVQAGIQSMADRYTYLPGIGIAIAVVWGGRELLQWRGVLAYALGRSAVAAAAILLLATLGTLTWRQARTWRDDETLFAHAAAVTGDSYWASYNLGLTLLDAHRPGEAVPRFEEAARLEPTSVEALINLGRALEQSGRASEATAAFRRAHQTAPGDLAAARHASRALVSNGSPTEAKAVVEEAIGRWPEDPQLRYTHGLAELLLDRPASAIEPLRRAVALDPAYAAAHNALGIALARTGDHVAAIEHFERAVEIEPAYHEARDNLTRLQAAPGSSG